MNLYESIYNLVRIDVIRLLLKYILIILCLLVLLSAINQMVGIVVSSFYSKHIVHLFYIKLFILWLGFVCTAYCWVVWHDLYGARRPCD